MEQKNKLDGVFDDEFSNDNIIKTLKPHLRFNVGDLACLKSDVKQNVPMTITKLVQSDDWDYNCSWMTSQRNQEIGYFLDKALTPYIIKENEKG